jgi:hypothetical protein
MKKLTGVGRWKLPESGVVAPNEGRLVQEPFYPLPVGRRL